MERDNNLLKYDSNGYLDVPGASLYYEVKGTGPVLILIPGANGDAEIFRAIREPLTRQFTVIIYDRRGFSRSTITTEGYDFNNRLNDDADDVIALTQHISPQPAFVFGSSSGALVALNTLLKHADSIRMLIPHEPPALSLIPDSGKWRDFFREVLTLYKTEGIPAAMQKFVTGLVGPQDAKAMQNNDMVPDGNTLKNSKFWFEYELPIYPYTDWRTSDFMPYREKILPANGVDSKDLFPTLANRQLSQDLGIDILTVPGGHLGYTFYPEPFAETLTKALEN